VDFYSKHVVQQIEASGIWAMRLSFGRSRRTTTKVNKAADYKTSLNSDRLRTYLPVTLSLCPKYGCSCDDVRTLFTPSVINRCHYCFFSIATWNISRF